MRVILLNDLRETGRRGEEVDVKPGFARNYLIPKGIAVEATTANRNWFEQQRSKIEAEAAKEREAAAEVAAQLAAVKLEIVKRAGESETLYGSVTATDIADALLEKGFEVDKRRIDLGGGIKTLGDHTVSIYLHAEVTADIDVTVVAEE